MRIASPLPRPLPVPQPPSRPQAEPEPSRQEPPPRRAVVVRPQDPLEGAVRRERGQLPEALRRFAEVQAMQAAELLPLGGRLDLYA